MANIANALRGVREYLTPVLASSAFHERGVLTPEEFVAAGDHLVYMCPTWQWSCGDPSRAKPFLPPDKQFLITRNVPSLLRATEYELSEAKEAMVEVGDDDDGWCATHVDRQLSNESEYEDMDGVTAALDGLHIRDGYVDGSRGQDGGGGPEQQGDEVKKEEEEETQPPPQQEHQPEKEQEEQEEEEEEEDIPDMDEFEDATLLEEEDDEATIQASAGTDAVVLGHEGGGANIVRTRTYDLSITYDKYHQTPRLYMFGYDEDRNPLTPVQIMQDVSGEHANKTVTVDAHPHTAIPHASIHPCQHAHVMKRLVDMFQAAHAAANADDEQVFDVRNYLFLFLKFMSAVIPTIEYDFSMKGNF